MDKDRIMQEASEFVNEGDGYIHSEMKNGKSPKLVISGDMLGILWQVCGIINRVSEITGTSFNETASLAFSLPSMGYRKVSQMRKESSKNGEMKYYVGEDWNEKWKKEQLKKIQRESSLECLSMAVNLKEMESRNASLNNQIVDLKKDHAKVIKAKDEQIQALTKECQALEHRMKEMEQHTILPMKGKR